MNKDSPCNTSYDDMAYTLIIELIKLPTDIYDRDGNFGSIQDLSITESRTINIRNYPETQLIQNKILGFTPIVTEYFEKHFIMINLLMNLNVLLLIKKNMISQKS
jgi:hypothetical protein